MTTPTLREAAQALLDWVETPHHVHAYPHKKADDLRAALAEPQGEPVAYTQAIEDVIAGGLGILRVTRIDPIEVIKPAPLRDLSESEIKDIFSRFNYDDYDFEMSVARAIIAAAREKE